MKKNIFTILILIFPLSLFSQTSIPEPLVDIFLLEHNRLKTLVSEKNARLKMSEKELSEISKIINERKEEFFILLEKGKKSIPYGENGLPIGKADKEIISKVTALKEEASVLIYEILGEKRYIQFKKMLIDENGRRNSERLKKTANKKK